VILREIPFIGRRVELADLAEAFEAATRGRGFVALISGEPGIGKTRLADELGRAALARGAGVAWGRSWEAGGTPAYWPWTQVLRALRADRGADAVERALADRMSDLAPLLPELLPAQGATLLAEPVQARFRLFDAFAGLLRGLSAAAPIVILLDDLHSADLSSLHLLHFLARELHSMRVLVVGSYREQEARASSEHMELITRIAREGAVIPLARLGAADVALLVRSQLGDDANDALIASLQRSSEGNPLFLSEMMRLLSSRGGLPGAGQHLVPDTVRELIRARLEGVHEQTRNLIEFASVFGREFGTALLARVANLAPSVARERLEESGRAGLVVEIPGERWTFSHILIREVLYASIPAGLRARLHATLALSLEASSDHGPSDLAAVAHHRLLGAAESGVRQAVESVLTLSQRALSMFAFEDAVTVLESALRLLEAEPDEIELRARALVVLGEARIRAGDHARGKQACKSAAELAVSLADAEGLARAALAYGAEISAAEVDGVLVRLLEDALERIETSDLRLRARLMARLAAARQPAPDTSQPMALAREAIALARGIGDDDTLRTVLHFALAALVDYAEPDELVPLCQQSIALAIAARDKTHLLRAQGRMVFASLELGDVIRADVAIAAYESLARELPRHLYFSDALMMRAMRALMHGRFADADALVARARELRDPTANPFTRASILMHDVARDLVQERIHLMLSRSADAPEVLQILDTVGVDYVHAIRACAHARLGELDAARRHLETIADDAPLMIGEPQGQRLLVEAAVAVKDARRAALLEARLGKLARRVLTWGRFGMVCDAPATRLLGLLAGVRGAHQEARSLLEDAFARTRDMGHVALLPRLGLELAQELVRGGAPDELESARDVLAEASRGADALGYQALGETARSLASRISGSVSSASPAFPVPVATGFTLTRAGEFYSVEHEGRVAHIKNSMGMRLLDVLVSSPGRERHVLELVATEGAVLDGDAGELLDQHAISEYKRRLEDLRETAREAEAFGDSARRAKAEAEIEALSDELARGVGLGGRGRRAGAAAERARINVQRRLRDAIQRIENELPELGRHLAWAVKTGVFCSYSPDRRS
jgi:tetratricopeptide (TPR) repeat protein